MQAVSAQLTQSNLKGLFIPIDAVIRDENDLYLGRKAMVCMKM
jgi:hypothetical protein